MKYDMLCKNALNQRKYVSYRVVPVDTLTSGLDFQDTLAVK